MGSVFKSHGSLVRRAYWAPARTYKFLRRYRVPLIPLAILLAMGIIGAFGPFMAPNDPDFGDPSQGLLPPFWLTDGDFSFPLGTDFLGRGILSRILDGAQTTMLTAALALTGAMLIGVTLGLTSGYVGGYVDMIAMRLVDFMLSMPALLLALVVVAVLGPSLRNLVMVVVVVSWVLFARFIRGEVLSLKERDFITAARAIGSSHARIAGRHLLPNVAATILVLATLQTGAIILLVAGLSFLGLGLPKPNSAWGVMISDGRSWLSSAWWISVFPGVAISLLIISLNIVGDWMRDFFDPNLRRSQ